jgi:TonB family protein
MTEPQLMNAEAQRAREARRGLRWNVVTGPAPDPNHHQSVLCVLREISAPLRCSFSPGLAILITCVACNRADPDTVRLPESAVRRGEDPPVMINAQTPVEYPPTLFARGIEGKVLLRLYVDETGALTADSTRVAESSGYPALDSAALAAVPSFKFAPAMKNGAPVAGTFLQPIHFRHPQAGGTTP